MIRVSRIDGTKSVSVAYRPNARTYCREGHAKRTVGRYMVAGRCRACGKHLNAVIRRVTL